MKPAPGLEKLARFSAWRREHETSGSESEKQGESERQSLAVSSFPEKGEEAFGEGELTGSK